MLTSLVSCRSNNATPPIKIERLTAQDSLVYLFQQGDSISRIDTLYLGDNTLEYPIDTALYKRLHVLYLLSDSVRYYQWQANGWERTLPQDSLQVMPKTFPVLLFTDISRKVHTSSSLTAQAKACYVFTDIEGKALTKAERDRLTKLYSSDSLQFVYLYLSPRDSVVRAWSKRDSLKGIFISDSLADVSRLRQKLGIDRMSKPYIVVVDSSQRILKHQ